MTEMGVGLGKLRLKNPVIAASGTFGFGGEFSRFFDLSRLGGISCKALTLEPRAGNAPPRVAETPMGMLNAVGLQNPGIDTFIRSTLPWLLRQDVAVIANIAAFSLEEYAELARRLDETDVHAIELNISCPNVTGHSYGTYPGDVAKATGAARKQTQKPLIVKLSPNTADIAENARAAEGAGADMVSLVNTITGLAIDARSRRPILANVTGGLSGPAIKPVALRMVLEAYRAVSIPVIGMGGIMSGTDAAEFMLAGASAVMVGTAGIADPMALPRIVDELARFGEEQGLGAIGELTGKLIKN